jgi:hypothetical protein
MRLHRAPGALGEWLCVYVGGGGVNCNDIRLKAVAGVHRGLNTEEDSLCHEIFF